MSVAVGVALSGAVLQHTQLGWKHGMSRNGRDGGNPLAAVATGEGVETEPGYRPAAVVRMLALIPDGTSPMNGASWPEVAAHLRQRTFWFSERYDLVYLTESQLQSEDGLTLLGELGVRAHAIVALDLKDPGAVATLTSYASTALRRDQVLLTLGGDASLAALDSFRGFKPATMAPSLLVQKLPFLDQAGMRGMKVLDTAKELYARHNSDDLLYLFLVLSNAYIEAVPEVANSIDDSSLSTLGCMLGKCGKEVIGCVRDDSCSTALNCLQGCKFNDQVCSYRCIASYESPLLEAFSLCILQKHNCLGLNAQPPALPDPAPMTSFRGMPMTHDLAEDLFVGWLDPTTSLGDGEAQGDKRPFSWRVAAGKNPAYDYFPCQYQLYYRGKAKGSVWYDPIFKVKTLDGQEVWRERHYRVRRAEVPGTFTLTVLDNGVISKEFWRIVDCDEGLQWCLFYYSGAASVAGVSYSGAILATVDGAYPPESDMPRVEAALDRAGIKRWELSTVDNIECEDAPLRPLSEPAEKQLAVL